jgi:outer membrane protein OmpA-like peptidoglycan-associated protein
MLHTIHPRTPADLRVAASYEPCKRSAAGLIGHLVLLAGLASGLSGSAVSGRESRVEIPPASVGAAANPDGRLAALTSDGREEIPALATTKPSIDLEITFGVDSVVLTHDAKRQVASLGKALTSPDLAGVVFVIAGHTDGLEAESYSQDLSEQRADVVKHELVTAFAVPAGNLVTIGYGSSHLNDPHDPFALINNRVQVVSMGTR